MTQSRRRKQLNNTKKLYWSFTKPNFATMKYYKVFQISRKNDFDIINVDMR